MHNMLWEFFRLDDTFQKWIRCLIFQQKEPYRVLTRVCSDLVWTILMLYRYNVQSHFDGSRELCCGIFGSSVQAGRPWVPVLESHKF